MPPEEETKVCPSCGFERCLHVSRCKCEYDKPTGLVHKAWFEQMKKERDEALAEVEQLRNEAASLSAGVCENLQCGLNGSPTCHARIKVEQLREEQDKARDQIQWLKDMVTDGHNICERVCIEKLALERELSNIRREIARSTKEKSSPGDVQITLDTVTKILKDAREVLVTRGKLDGDPSMIPQHIEKVFDMWAEEVEDEKDIVQLAQERDELQRALSLCLTERMKTDLDREKSAVRRLINKNKSLRQANEDFLAQILNLAGCKAVEENCNRPDESQSQAMSDQEEEEDEEKRYAKMSDAEMRAEGLDCILCGGIHRSKEDKCDLNEDVILQLLEEKDNEICRLTIQRDEARNQYSGARARTEMFRTERDEARSVLRKVRSWRRAAVGLEPRPTIDAETLDKRIDAVLDGPPYREKDPSDPLRMVRALAKAERERDDARAEIQRLKAEVECLRAALSDVGVLVGLGRKWPDDLDAFAVAVDDAVYARLVAQRERDEARAEVERLKAEVEQLTLHTEENN